MLSRLGLGNGSQDCNREGYECVCNIQSLFGFACKPGEAFRKPSIPNWLGSEGVGVEEPGVRIAWGRDCNKVPPPFFDSFDIVRLHIVIEEIVLVLCNQYVYLFNLDNDTTELFLLL